MRKRMKILLLAVLFLVSMAASAYTGYRYGTWEQKQDVLTAAAEEAPTIETTVPPVSSETRSAETEAPETEAPETEPSAEGTLFLTVSEINFSVVGESEYIYAGTVPKGQITWTSEDESIVTVDNGVLTAVGVGTTTVTASCDGQQVSCQAGCLAETREDLALLSSEVLRSPKRIPPQVGDEVLSFYEDAAMLGDSITYGFMKYEARNGRLGSPRCLCRGSLGIRNMLTHNLDLYYQGAEMHLEDVLAAVAPRKVFILLGTNDVMVRSADTVISELDQLLDRVMEKNPDLEIYLQSVFPIVCNSMGSNGTNEQIMHYNKVLRDYARKQGYHYVPVAPYLQDHIPGFADIYQQDTYHPSYEGVCAWIDALRAYAYIQQLKGE